MEHWSWYIESIYGILVLIENTYEPWSWYRESIYTYGTVVMIQGINIYLWNSGHDTENQYIPMEQWSWYWESTHTYGTLVWYIESEYGTLVMIQRINKYLWNIGHDREYVFDWNVLVFFTHRALIYFVRGSMTVWLTSCLIGLDLAERVNLLLIKHKQISWIQTSQTGSQPYYHTSYVSVLYVYLLCSAL